MAKKYPLLSVNLKKLLFEKDMKPVDLARELDIPQPTIHRLVTGKSTRPYRSSLEPIAAYFSLTVDQLLGEHPMPDDYFKDAPSSQSQTLPAQNAIKTIPVIAWNDTKNKDAKDNAKRQIVTAGSISDDCFALIMQDYSMEPIFPRSTILVFDPQKPALDRSYVLVKLKNKDTPVFRQLLVDVDHKFLKPLNPDSDVYQMRVLGYDDEIIATLFESRMNHEPEEASTTILEGR